MKYLVLSPFVIKKLVEATFLQGKPLQRFYDVVFFLPHMFKDTHHFCKSCESCQKFGGITHRNMMPLNPILLKFLIVGA